MPLIRPGYRCLLCFNWLLCEALCGLAGCHAQPGFWYLLVPSHLAALRGPVWPASWLLICTSWLLELAVLHWRVEEVCPHVGHVDGEGPEAQQRSATQQEPRGVHRVHHPVLSCRQQGKAGISEH